MIEACKIVGVGIVHCWRIDNWVENGLMKRGGIHDIFKIPSKLRDKGRIEVWEMEGFCNVEVDKSAGNDGKMLLNDIFKTGPILLYCFS